MNDEQLAGILRRHAFGKSNAIRSQGLARIAGEAPERTEAPLRQRIRCLIEKGYPIGSCSKGFFWIATEQELAEVIEGLWARTRSIGQRVKDLRKAFSSPSET